MRASARRGRPAGLLAGCPGPGGAPSRGDFRGRGRLTGSWHRKVSTTTNVSTKVVWPAGWRQIRGAAVTREAPGGSRRGTNGADVRRRSLVDPVSAVVATGLAASLERAQRRVRQQDALPGLDGVPARGE